MLGVINIGELDERLSIQRASITNHEVSNEEIKTWETLLSIWVKVLGPISKESFEDRQQVAKDEVRLFARRGGAYSLLTVDNTYISVDNTNLSIDYTGIVKHTDEKMRILFRGQYWQINSIEDGGRRGFVILKAERRDNG